DRHETSWRNTTTNRWRAEAFCREALRLPGTARTKHIQSLAVEFVRPGFRDDVQRRSVCPSEFGRERVRQHIELLNGAHWDCGDCCLTTPAFVVARPIKHE